MMMRRRWGGGGEEARAKETHRPSRAGRLCRQRLRAAAGTRRRCSSTSTSSEVIRPIHQEVSPCLLRGLQGGRADLHSGGEVVAEVGA